jgi:hypothetical protein
MRLHLLPVKKVKAKTFQQLVSNAMDFLSHAVKDLAENKPKYSVINFCAAIELFLKARLLHEHWTLVITGKGELDSEKFKSGAFISVTVDEAIDRIAKVLQEPLTDAEKKCFKALRDERNRFVHFSDAQVTNPKLRYEVALTELQAWRYIYNRLTKTWSEYFGAFDADLKELDRKMNTMTSLAKMKFKLISQSIQSEIKKKVEYKKCTVCKQRAAKVTLHCNNLFSVKCRVCLRPWEEHFLRERCKCGARVDYTGESEECRKCGSEVTVDSLLDKYAPSVDPHSSEKSTYHCGNCRSEAVVQWGNEWLCLDCLALHKDVSHCDHCNTAITGSGEDTSWKGCFMCEGPDWGD